MRQESPSTLDDLLVYDDCASEVGRVGDARRLGTDLSRTPGGIRRTGRTSYVERA